MDFARKQLEKYGWSDGKGLGKNENGISQPLKPKIKRSVTGVGHDLAADFNEHWWSALYNKAAANVEVEENNGKIKKIKTKGDLTITTNTWQMNKGSKMEAKEQYSDFFVRTAVLSKGGNNVENVKESDSDENSDTDKKDVLKMTDEELFAACEGRTAHKGARHGLKATGKLARIAQQEAMLLSQSKYNGYSHAKKGKGPVVDGKLSPDMTECKKKKKKKKRCLSNANLVIENSKDHVSSMLSESMDDISAMTIHHDNMQKKMDTIDNADKVDDKLEKTKKKKKRKMYGEESTMETDAMEIRDQRDRKKKK